MKCVRPIGLVLVATLSLVHTMPTEKSATTTTTTSTRSTPAFGDTIKKLTNQLIDVNATTLDMVSDTRTPPKVKQQVKLKEELENSHAGVAIPVDEEAVEMDESTKKMNFYKIERPTTNSGLSTWILLSGQESSTTKPTTRRPIIKPVSTNNTKDNMTVVADKPNRIIKPIFRKRTPTTPKPSVGTTPITTTTTTKVTTEPTKLTKIKASVLNSAVHRKNLTTKAPTPTTTTEIPTSSTLMPANNSTLETTTAKLGAEAKEGEVDLTNPENKKKKTTNKRRKNKPKRRKPSNKTNSTSISKPNKTLNKQNAISTQLYNYLAREIMPTVGVGLVGLMVTAGLASYFLYPFGAARRVYDVDRKDKEGSYYYSDDYSSGIPEEEAIGKVIAGMPSNTLFPSNNYKSSTSRDTYPDTKYTLKDRKAQIRPQYYGNIVQGSTDNIPVTPKYYNYQNNNFEPVTYTNDQVSRYSPNSDQRFVVGSNIPKEVAEEATPAVVPEHGPRNFNLEENMAEEPTYLFKGIAVNSTDMRREYGPRSIKIRKKRSGISNEIESEVHTLYSTYEYTTTDDETTTEIGTDTTTIPSSTRPSSTIKATNAYPPTTTETLPQKVSNFIDMMKDVIQLKARLGMQIIQNITDGITKYISNVQTKFDEHYKNFTKPHN